MKFLLALAGAILTQSLVGQTSGEAKTPSPSPLAAEARFDHTLSGDWGGARSALADHGLSLDLRYTQFFDGLLAGDLRSDAAFGSRIDAMLTLDTGKLGLWQGGGLRTHLESRFGDAPSQRGGALWPLNSGLALPLGGTERLVASSLYLTQKFGADALLMVGKINAVDLLASDPFFGGWGRDRFQNIAFVAPPSGVVPPTIMGAVLSLKQDPFAITFMAFDPDDRTNDYAPDDLFSRGVNLSLSVTWAGQVAGRASSVGVTGTYSTKDGADLGQLLLPPELRTGPRDGAFNVALSLSHLLLESRQQSGKGLGVYVKAALADGNPNPIQASVVAGLAGHGIIPGRPRDSFGLGWFYYDFSDDLQDALAPALTFQDEQGLEFFYSCALTPWLALGADLQWIDPARGDQDTAVYAGLRTTITF